MKSRWYTAFKVYLLLKLKVPFFYYFWTELVFWLQAKAAAAKAAIGAGSRGNIAKQEQLLESQKQKTSTLPTNFFDNQGTKRQSDGENT